MSRSIIPHGGNDKVMTPYNVAYKIVEYFDIGGKCGQRIMEPCKGTGNFYNSIRDYTKSIDNHDYILDYAEIDEGIDFLSTNLSKKYTFVVSNPPFSQFRAFLNKSMEIADNVIFLSLINAFFFKARFRDIKETGFGFKEIIAVDTPPPPWPQFGIQLGVVHLQKGYTGDTKFTHGFSQTV